MKRMTLATRKLLRDLEMLALAVVAWVPLHVARISVLRLAGADIARGVTIYHGFEVRRASRLRVGARSSIGDRAILDARGGLEIGNDVNISTGVQIWSAQHDWQSDTFAYVALPVTIEHHVWIGPGSIVLPCAIIRAGTVVAAGAVVKGEVGPDVLVGGIPARAIRDRPPGLNYRLPDARHKSWWW